MIAPTEAEYQVGDEFTKDTSHLTLIGELWSIFCEHSWENWTSYNDTTRYIIYAIIVLWNSIYSQPTLDTVVYRDR